LYSHYGFNSGNTIDHSLYRLVRSTVEQPH
jgi:hypothetical protein